MVEADPGAGMPVAMLVLDLDELLLRLAILEPFLAVPGLPGRSVGLFSCKETQHSISYSHKITYLIYTDPCTQ